ncbi:hypothetical protein OGATHE_004971 [Ogataea polymorpha]|uniref:Uncharacterized protein n=1 Tax=Ogataea polymorpha TaxID=460523 RepID=A0A9P8NWC0_9ASCO|nr:hypothetical protein OGATHE_004971 [Ogataea polymorpha]
MIPVVRLHRHVSDDGPFRFGKTDKCDNQEHAVYYGTEIEDGSPVPPTVDQSTEKGRQTLAHQEKSVHCSVVATTIPSGGKIANDGGVDANKRRNKGGQKTAEQNDHPGAEGVSGYVCGLTDGADDAAVSTEEPFEGMGPAPGPDQWWNWNCCCCGRFTLQTDVTPPADDAADDAVYDRRWEYSRKGDSSARGPGV